MEGEIDGSVVRFDDGSEANFEEMVVINRGKAISYFAQATISAQMTGKAMKAPSAKTTMMRTRKAKV